MNGAESLLRTALASGVDVCFANPGTTEMPLVAALDTVGGLRSVLALFEGVCTGAADGYGRMSGKPALTLLHLGPGFANGIANLHNARRAHSPIVNVIGDMTTWHLAADAPLTSDITSLASPVSSWVRTNSSADTLGRDLAEAIAASLSTPGGVATLIAPADCQWGDGGVVAKPIPPVARPAVSSDALDGAARALRSKKRTVLFLGGAALGRRGLEAAARVAAISGCRLMSETFSARIERGRGIPAAMRLPYFPEQAIAAFGDAEIVVLAGAKDPVAFFGYPDVPSRLVPEGCGTLVLARIEEDAAGAIEALADALGAPKTVPLRSADRPSRPTGELSPQSLGEALAALQPQDAIVVDEGATSGFPYGGVASAAPPHSCLMLTGGAIGQGLPTATGAAIACPDRRVIALQADGSSLYTIQSLWTMARESLDVTTILCSNRAYRILQIEAARAGNVEPGKNARRLTELDHPAIDFVGLARGFGVPAVRVETADDLVKHLDRSLREAGPSLIEAVL